MQHEHSDHVHRARERLRRGVLAHLRRTAIALTDTRESDTISVLDPHGTLPIGATCTFRVEGDPYTDTDTADPPDTGTDFTATFTTTAIEGLRSTTSRAGSTSRRTATRSSPTCRAWSPRRASTASTSRTPSPTATPAPEGIFVFTGSPVRSRRSSSRRTVSGRVIEFRQGCTPTCAAPDFPAGLRLGHLPQPDAHRDRPRDGDGGGAGATIQPTIVGRGGRESPTR